MTTLTSLCDVLLGRYCFPIDGEAERQRAISLLIAENALDSCVNWHGGRVRVARRFTMTRRISVGGGKRECCIAVYCLRKQKERALSCSDV